MECIFELWLTSYFIQEFVRIDSVIKHVCQSHRVWQGAFTFLFWHLVKFVKPKKWWFAEKKNLKGCSGSWQAATPHKELSIAATSKNSRYSFKSCDGPTDYTSEGLDASYSPCLLRIWRQHNTLYKLAKEMNVFNICLCLWLQWTIQKCCIIKKNFNPIWSFLNKRFQNLNDKNKK